MLKIHKPFSKHKLFLISITSICIVTGLLGFYYLTYTPELSRAETVDNVDRRTMDDITYMQDITPEICQNSELNKQYTLTDKRDDNTYTVARIKNQTNDEANCWMTQNLRIINKEISYLDSDIEEGSFTIPTSNISGFTSSDQHHPKAYYDSTYGGYYNWYTATAGSEISVNVTNSVCPKKWRLPTGGNNSSELYDMFTGLAATQITNIPYNVTYSGWVGANTITSTGGVGYLWSSTVATNLDDSAYQLEIFRNTVNPSRSGAKSTGLSVRCLTPSRSVPNNNVDIAINPAISIDVTNEVEVKKSDANPSTANLDINVTSNQPYSININAKDHAELTSNTTEVKIPSASGTLSGSSNEWGIKKPEETEYTAVATTPQLFYQSSVAEIKTIPFTIGISTTPDIPNGEYSTDITITATQN